MKTKTRETPNQKTDSFDKYVIDLRRPASLAPATGSATPLDDLTPTKECDCEFTPDPTEPDVESVHYLRRCQKCKATWWSLHCPHDGIQGRCSCGERGQVWPNDQAER